MPPSIDTSNAQTEDQPVGDKPAEPAPWPRWLLMLLLGLVIFARGRALYVMSDSMARDPDSYERLAYNLRDLHEFGWWGSTQFELTAFRPPLYPLLIAPFLVIPGIGFVHVILGAATVWAVWRLARQSGLSQAFALVAAGLVTIDPILVNQQAQVMTETLAACLAALTLLAITRVAAIGSLGSGIAAGALLGLCVLCRPTFAVWLGMVVVAMPFCARLAWRKAVAASVAMLLSAAAVLAPWAARNLRQFGAPVFTTTHGGFTLLLANNPEFYEYLRSAPWGSTWDAEGFNANWSEQASQNRIQGSFHGCVDEVDNDRRAYRQAFENIRNQPAMFAWASLTRVGWLWGVLPHQLSPEESPSRRGMRYAVAIFYSCELLLAAAGAWFARARLGSSPWLWGLLLLASFTIVHAFYWTDLRMRAPLMPVVALWAAWATSVLAAPNQPRKALSALGLKTTGLP